MPRDFVVAFASHPSNFESTQVFRFIRPGPDLIWDMGILRIAVFSAAIALFASSTSAQSFEASVHLASSQWSEFDGTDIGVGGRFTWKPSAVIGVDADLTWYPGEFPPDGVPFSENRFEGLFGVTAGPHLAGFRPFAKVGAGFMNVGGVNTPFACITIFPPPLACVMAGGETMQAYEFGGGIEILPTGSTLLRLDITDRVLKYPGPSIADREVHDEAFWGHALRFTIGAGWRF